MIDRYLWSVFTPVRFLLIILLVLVSSSLMPNDVWPGTSPSIVQGSNPTLTTSDDCDDECDTLQISVVSGTPQFAQVQTSFSEPLVVQVTDDMYAPLADIAVTFYAPDEGASASFDNNPVLTDAEGRAQISAQANNLPGEYVVTARIEGATAPASFNLTNRPPPAITVIDGTPQTAVVGAAFAVPLQILVQDGAGNPVANQPVTFSVPTLGASARLNRTTVTTSAAGQAEVIATANTLIGSYTVTVRATGFTPASFELTNTVGPPDSITITSGTRQSAVIHTQFEQPLQVLVRDAYLHPVPNVPVTFTPPTSGASVVFSDDSTTITTNDQGVAEMIATANGVIGSYSVAVSAAGVPTSLIFSLTNQAPAPAAIIASAGTSQAAIVNTVFDSPLQVTVYDAEDNPIPGVVVTFSAPDSGASAVLSSSNATTDADGHASVSASAGSIVGTYTVTAQVSGLDEPVAFNLTNQPGAPASASATSEASQTATIGKLFAVPLQLTVLDVAGNPVPDIGVTFDSPTSGATAVLSSTTATTDAQGQAEVTATASNTAGRYAVTATVSGLTEPVVFNLTNLAGSPASITISSGNEQSSVVRTAFSTPLQVTVQDAEGNPVPEVTITFRGPPGAARVVLSSTTATTDAQGQAEVTATAGHAPGSYSVTASVPEISSSVSFSLTNLLPPQSRIKVMQGEQQRAQVGNPFATRFQVVVTDAEGQPLAEVPVTFTAPTSGPGGTFAIEPETVPDTATSTDPTSVIVLTDANGVATAPPFTANNVPGSYTIIATVDGVAEPVRFDLVNSAKVASSSVVYLPLIVR